MKKIIVPPSAKKDPAFGNKKCMRVGGLGGITTVVFDEEFNVIHAIDDDDGQSRQFDNNVALDRWLDMSEARVRYHTVELPYHGGGIDDYLFEMGITIENKVEEPWNVEFSGSRFALMTMIYDHWVGPKDWVEFEKYVAAIEGATPDYNV